MELHPPKLVPIRKPRGGIRWLSLLDREDQIEYRTAVENVARRVDSRLGSCVASDRRGPMGTQATSSRWWPAWERFREAAAAADEPTVLRTDVRDCFPRIGPASVERALLEARCHPSDVGRIVDFLDRMCLAGVRGLPVGPEPSAILASAVLARVDDVITGSGFRHIRWVDDFFVFVPAGRDAYDALDRIATALAACGLEPVPEKTAVLPSAEMRRELEHRAGSIGAETSGAYNPSDHEDPVSGVARTNAGPSGDRGVVAGRRATRGTRRGGGAAEGRQTG